MNLGRVENLLGLALERSACGVTEKMLARAWTVTVMKKLPAYHRRCTLTIGILESHGGLDMLSTFLDQDWRPLP